MSNHDRCFFKNINSHSHDRGHEILEYLETALKHFDGQPCLEHELYNYVNDLALPDHDKKLAFYLLGIQNGLNTIKQDLEQHMVVVRADQLPKSIAEHLMKIFNITPDGGIDLSQFKVGPDGKLDT